jgi:signal transduction histidine kinase
MPTSLGRDPGPAHRPAGSTSPGLVRRSADPVVPPQDDVRRVAEPYIVGVAANPTVSQRIADAVVALGFLGVGWISTAAPAQTDPDFRYTPRDWMFVLLLVLATAPYAWRRRWPAPVFLAGLLATTALWLLGYNTGALPLVLLVGAYFVAAARPAREVVACVGAALGCFSVLWWGGGAPYDAGEAFASVLTLGATAWLGRASRLRVDLAEARAQAAEEAARRRSSEERLRIARELHDIVGHTLGTIAVQAGVGKHLIATEPGQAADALDNIARISRSSLDEVRAVVATLREGEPSYHPAPGLADLPELVETARTAGLTVRLTLPDDVEAIPRQTGVAVYRITREALTNVVRHAHASAASVQVTRRNGLVEVAIRDDGSGRGAGSTPGLGITGMRERAEALGGTLSAGPATGGGFLVTASLPVDAGRSR